MIKEIYHFLRYNSSNQKRVKEMGLVEFQKNLVARVDADGYAELRSSLVGDLEGDILEIGTGTGATFQYYNSKAKVTAIEPHDEFRAEAIKAARNAKAEIQVIASEGENLPFEDAAFDAVSASLVLCSVASPLETLEEFKRVLRPGGQARLLEHVRSEHWLTGPIMDLFNPMWLRINKLGCNWNRKTVEAVETAGYFIRSVEPFKIYTSAFPATFPVRIIKAKRSA
jgi:ubiquinone/menaquinone biosynthesis C-methylase UbiE